LVGNSPNCDPAAQGMARICGQVTVMDEKGFKNMADHTQISRV